MNLTNARILFAAQYAAPYAGNFVASLTALDDYLAQRYNAVAAYVFPADAEKQKWYDQFAAGHKVYTVQGNLRHSQTQCARILQDFGPTIVHTHFEGFDLPMTYAARHLDRKPAMVWHMHDALSFMRHPLKRLYQYYCFWRHYGNPLIFTKLMRGGVKPSFIAVCKHELDFIRPYRMGRRTHERVIPNSVAQNRMKTVTKTVNDHFTFLGFGGRNVQKRADVMMRAGAILAGQGKRFELKITGNAETHALASRIFGADNRPSWLKIIEPVEDVSALYASADCFISASQCETFSYAIAEATLMQLPVIQTDIEGTAWNKNNPSAITVPAGDAGALSLAMKQMMDKDPETLKTECATTLANNSAFLSMDRWCKDIAGFYTQL